jgi:membrane-bound lytic murein transglycosylase B
MPTTEEALRQVLETIKRTVQSLDRPADALDEILADAPRIVGVQRLDQSPAYRQALQDIVDGRIQVDAFRRGLELASELLNMALKGGAV